MIKDFAEESWKKIRNWQKKRRDNQISKANSKREQSIGVLRKRYGYTKEKAAAELDEHYPKARLF